MSKLKLSDIIALSRAGYRASEIRAMSEMPEEPEEPETPAEPEATPEPEAPAEPEATPDPEEPDYRSMYNELKASVDDLKDKLHKAQQKNVNQPAPPVNQVTPAEYITNLINEFF